MKRYKREKVTECCGGANMGGIKVIYLVDTSRVDTEAFSIYFSEEQVKSVTDKYTERQRLMYGNWDYDTPLECCTPISNEGMPACEAAPEQKILRSRN